jgi:cytochrome c oxidase subunit III
MNDTLVAPEVSASNPPQRRELIPSGLLAVSIFIVTELMLFTGFISAFMIVKGRAVGGIWPPAGQPLLPAEETAINTAALVISGLLLIVTEFAFRRNANLAKVPMGLSIGLGAWFVAAQGAEWAALLEQGLTLTSSAHGAFFYTIVGFHGIHAVIALGFMLAAFVRLMIGTLTAGQLWATQAFWYFVVGIWPLIYWQVYL